ncbi:MAG: hypothetical protein EOP00_11615 [Pedobacter sp.]|nr:MAG: hypothetical protein EOP00_11615 [Pedobacter sp.]
MKTAEILQKKVDENKNYLIQNRNSIGNRALNRISRENENFIEIIRYLQTNPKETFVISEKERLERIIKAKNEQYFFWRTNVCPDHVDDKQKRSLFNKEVGINVLRRQLKNICFILQD